MGQSTQQEFQRRRKKKGKLNKQERRKKGKGKKKKSNIRDVWDNIKWANLCIIGIPEGEEKEKGI